jgi:glucokinase
MKVLLAGDIGGTKTSLGLFSSEQDLRRPLRKETYPSSDFPDLESTVAHFLRKADTEVDYACFGVSGPVIDGKAGLTNLPWTIDERQLSSVLHIPVVRLLNDLAALAESIPYLTEDGDMIPLKRGVPAPGGNRAIIAPGTGLGEAFSVWDASVSAYRVLPSEGGHCDFAPRNTMEEDLLGYLRLKIGHVSYESVCSGLGIQNIYCYLQESQTVQEPLWLCEAMSQAEDPTPLIIQNAIDPERSLKICRKTLEIFISILGAEAGNLALKVLATGGIYLGGGIPQRVLPLLANDAFLQSFADKGRFSNFLSRIPIHVILCPDAGLIGAARYGLAAIF